MRKLPTAAALALLLVTAGVVGGVAAAPNSTDTRPSDATASTVATAESPSDDDDTTFEQRLARRLAQFDLTDAQVREIVTEAARLREAGASRLVVRSSVVMNLYEFGVDAPFLYAGTDEHRPGEGHDRFHRYVRSLDVTPEQARELHSMVHRMLDAGATRGEVREAVRRQLAAWDDDRPGDDDPGDGIDRLVRELVDRYDLDRRQGAELERLIRGMLSGGADRDEIRRAVARLLDSYGVWDDEPAALAVPR